MIEKTCGACGKTYPATVEYFHRQQTTKSGLRHVCKPCARQKALDHFRTKPKNTEPRNYDKLIPRTWQPTQQDERDYSILARYIEDPAWHKKSVRAITKADDLKWLATCETETKRMLKTKRSDDLCVKW